MKLNQLLPREMSVKTKVNRAKSDLYHQAQKPGLFNGFLKRYTPKNEEGEKFPDEKQKVQVTAKTIVEEEFQNFQELLDVESAKDASNCNAKADIIVDGKVVATGVPATNLLLLSKELDNMYTLFDTIPVLSEDETWTVDATSGLAKSEPTQTGKTKKVQKALVLYQATDKHPAQCQLITEDEIVGSWETVKVSGAMLVDEKKALLKRVSKLSEAVRSALEQANMVEAVEPNVGSAIVKFLQG